MTIKSMGWEVRRHSPVEPIIEEVLVAHATVHVVDVPAAHRPERRAVTAIRKLYSGSDWIISVCILIGGYLGYEL